MNEAIKRCRYPVILLWLFVIAGTASAQPDNGQRDLGQRAYRLVAFGDSTTFGYALPNQAYPLQLAIWLTKNGYPVYVVNAGVNGHTTEAGRDRFERDVLARRPDCVIVQYGLNDQTVRLYSDPETTPVYVTRKRYEENLRYFVVLLRKQRVRAVLMTSNPMVWTDALEKRYPEGPFMNGPKAGNRFLELYADSVRTVAHEEGVPLVDVYSAFTKISEKDKDALTKLFLGDGVHPNTEGYRLVSRLLTVPLQKLMPTPGIKTPDAHALVFVDDGAPRHLYAVGRGVNDNNGAVVLTRVDEPGNPHDRVYAPTELAAGPFRLTARIEIPVHDGACAILLGDQVQMLLGDGGDRPSSKKADAAISAPVESVPAGLPFSFEVERTSDSFVYRINGTVTRTLGAVPSLQGVPGLDCLAGTVRLLQWTLHRGR